MEAVEGLHRGEVVDVEVGDFVADLREDGVVELEEAQLHAGLARGGLDLDVVAGVGALELGQHLVGAADDGGGHAGEFGHVDAKAVLRAAGGEFAQEHDLAVYFLDRHVEVLDALE